MRYNTAIKKKLKTAVGDVGERKRILDEIHELGVSFVDVLSKRVSLPFKCSVHSIPLLPSEVRSGVANDNSYLLTLELGLSDKTPFFINVLSCCFRQNAAYPCVIRHGDTMRVCQNMRAVRGALMDAIRGRLAFVWSQCVVAEHINCNLNVARNEPILLSNAEPTANRKGGRARHKSASNQKMCRKKR